MQNLHRSLDKKIISMATASLLALALSISLITSAFAGNTVSLSTTISGGLSVGILDESFQDVVSPSVTMDGKDYSNDSQTSTGTMPSGTDIIGVTNATATETWALTMAATTGATAVWTDGSKTFDFNDSGADATDSGVDTDSVGGQLTVTPTGGVLTGYTPSTTTNIALGSATSFVEDSVDSVTLMSASAGADAPGQWTLKAISLSQSIPATQLPGTYTLGFTLTAS